LLRSHGVQTRVQIMTPNEFEESQERRRVMAIDEIMLDLESGRIACLVLSRGDFPGIGDKLFAVPGSALRTDPDGNGFLFDVDRKLLDNAPGLDKDNWPDMSDPSRATEVHDHFGKQA
jgi:hypothetical protein